MYKIHLQNFYINKMEIFIFKNEYIKKLPRFKKGWHGIDRHVYLTLAHRLWTVISGVCTIFLITIFFDGVQQGYYFTFASILALQIFFELGMGQVVVQIVAHEAASLRLTEAGRYEGDSESLARLTLLRSQLFRWYLPAALIFAMLVGAGGLIFFSGEGLDWSQWGPAWLILVGATAINLYYSWKLAMIEGFALVGEIAKLRLVQSIIGCLVMWLGLVVGFGLYVVISAPIVSAIATTFWLNGKIATNVLGIFSDALPRLPISWRQDIFPFQWRIAVSWISGYFLFQLFTPLIFKQVGAAEAGRLGLAMAMFSAIGTVGLSWVNAKAPTLSMLIARKEFSRVIEEFKYVAIRSFLVTAMLCTLAIMAVWIGSSYTSLVNNRIASLPVLFCIVIVTLSNCIVFSSAIYMRAHREEPMLPVSVTCAILTAILAWFASKHGALTMMLCYTGVTAFIALPWTLGLLRSYFDRNLSNFPGS